MVGRPRHAGADAAILRAARELLASGGYDAVVMEKVAAQAGVGKATLYRRFSGRAELVAEAVAAILAENVPVADHGSLRADLEAIVDALSAQITPQTADVVLRLHTEALSDETARDVLNNRLLASRREVIAGVISRAAKRGELTRAVVPDTLFDLIGGGLLLRACRHGGSVDAGFRREIVDLIVAGLSPVPAAPTSGRRRAATPNPKE